MMKKILFYSFVYIAHIHATDIQLQSLSELLTSHPEISYKSCHAPQPFHYEQFPISRFPELQPHDGVLAETYILTIRKGEVYSYDGIIKVGNSIMRESMFPNSMTSQTKAIQKISFHNPKKITGRVAVITTTSDYCYFHWIANVLVRLALLERYDIEYDWLYVGQDKPFMKQTLELWGIDPAKIIVPTGETKYIVADELIVPSPYIGERLPQKDDYVLSWVPLVYYCKKWGIDPTNIRTMNNEFHPAFDTPLPNDDDQRFFHQRTPLCSTYVPRWGIDHIRQKLSSCTQNIATSFSKKVFLSRKDATFRNMLNEDDVFARFEKQGFVRYNVGKLSIPEQIALFQNADVIVAAHGAGLINLIFCKPNTKVIEIFQARSDSCFYYLSQLLGLQHFCIQTMDFENIDGHHESTSVPLFIIDNFMKKFMDKEQL